MNEEQIVASLASKMPREQLLQRPDEPSKIVQEVVKEAEPTVSKPNEYPNDLAASKLMDFFDISRENQRNRIVLDKLNYIYAWGSKEANSEDSVDVMTKIRELEGRLGLTFKIGEKLESIYRYVKLDSQRRSIEKEISLI